MPEVRVGESGILYILYLAAPRFLNLEFEAKLTTIFHELYHISPEFNGDIRRFSGRNYAHGCSRKRYNERIRLLVEDYLSRPGAEEHTAFLRLNFDELAARQGRVVGTKLRPPKPRLVQQPAGKVRT